MASMAVVSISRGSESVDPSRSLVKSVTKGLFSDWIAVRRTVRRAGRQRCLAVQVTHAGHTHHLSVSVPGMRQQHRHVILAPSAPHKSGDVDCSPRGAQPPRCPRRLRARPMVWRCSAVLVGLSRDRRCIGNGRARKSGRSGHLSPCRWLAGWWIIHQHAAGTWSTDAVWCAGHFY